MWVLVFAVRNFSGTQPHGSFENWFLIKLDQKKGEKVTKRPFLDISGPTPLHSHQRIIIGWKSGWNIIFSDGSRRITGSSDGRCGNYSRPHGQIIAQRTSHASTIGKTTFHKSFQNKTYLKTYFSTPFMQAFIEMRYIFKVISLVRSNQFSCNFTVLYRIDYLIKSH